MIKRNITTSKQARYFLSQKPHAQIDEVWIVLHGYGQLANSFLNWFNPIFSKNKLFISPEGLHRFYWQGFNGKVAASWMTKEDRLDDIKDYVIYLNNILDHIKPQLSANTFYHLLGFSQGAATACRWLDLGSIELHSLTLWGGTFPDDIDYFNKMNTKFKAASWAYNNAKWSILIKVASELNIKPMNYKKMNGYLKKEIKSLNAEINRHKSTFGWRLYQAEEKQQKDNVIKLVEDLKFQPLCPIFCASILYSILKLSAAPTLV